MAPVITLEELRALVSSGAVDTVIAAFPDLYGRLMGKRLDARHFLSAPDAGTHACDYLFTVDMEMEPVAGYEFANWEEGYGDVHLVPDLSTLRVCSWLDRTAMVICDAVTSGHGTSGDDPHDHAPVAVAPRSILRRQVDRAAADGYHAMAASELEYFLYRTSYRDAARSGYADLEPAGWYIEDYHLLQGARTEDLNGAFRRHLAASGIPVESTKGEWGRGQHELNIAYADVDVMADRHVVMKHACKEIADAHGASVTFMAKPDSSEAGSSSHLHLSLWRHGVNVFASEETFRHFLGGWMTYAAELMVCLAPTINSYKRYQAQSWAPTAIAWSPDNRTTGFRIVGEGPAKRIECRIPGADVNPYLAYAAAVAAGIEGIEQEIEPPPVFVGDAYDNADLPPVPATLAEATEAFDGSAFARRTFGDDVVDHYVHFFRTEISAHAAAVTDWERRRYFERI